MIGILTEKPSAGRNFAKALGGMKGTYNGESYVIVSARGHLYGYKEPSLQVDSSKTSFYKTWSLDNLPWNENDFKWVREKKKDTQSTIKNIKTVLGACDEIVIATDVDPSGEGELLAWEILDETHLRPKKFSRMYFTDEAVSSIQKAFVSRKPIKSMLSDMDYVKATYRTQWDFLSMQWTRIATICGDGHSQLRQGRLKSAMVQIVGQQLDAIKNYKKVPYYQNRFIDDNKNVFVNKDEQTYPDKKLVPQIYVQSDVVVDSKEIKHTSPPKLLDLAGLSSILSGRGVKAKDVLATYQKMYESQVVSYPRTEDKCVTPEQFAELLPLVDKIAGVVGVDTALLTHRIPRSTHVKTGGAHGANRPGINVPKSLDELRQYGSCAPMIYEILAKNYLSILAEDYEYEYQKGHLAKYPKFTGTASVPLKQGYKAVFNNDDDDIDVSSKGLGHTAVPFVYEGFPPKPTQPTMKWLMKQLEKHDVGTGATRTSTYADVTSDKSKYPLLKEARGKLSMSQYGEMSYQIIQGTHIGDLKITEQVMADMRGIAEGKLNPDKCLMNIRQLIRDDIAVMKANGMKFRKESGGSMATYETKEKYTGTWNGKPVSFTRIWAGHRFTDDECEALCRGEILRLTGLRKKDGGTFDAAGSLAEQTYNGHKFVGFALRDDVVPDEWRQHKFTEDEKNMLELGQSVFIEDAVSKAGNPFSAKVHFGKNKYGRMGIIPEFN